jgi:Helix-turn-helix domain
MDWMTAAAYDRRLKPSDFKVAFVIAQHINAETGKAYPSEALVADIVGTSVRTVERTVTLLHETGWLRIRRKRTYDPKTKSWKTQNFYWLRYENVQTMFDLIKASRLKRRYFKPDTGDGLKPDTHVGLTPSYKHLQKRRKESTEEAISLRAERVSNGEEDAPAALPTDRVSIATQLAYLLQLGDRTARRARRATMH